MKIILHITHVYVLKRSFKVKLSLSSASSSDDLMNKHPVETTILYNDITIGTVSEFNPMVVSPLKTSMCCLKDNGFMANTHAVCGNGFS